MLTKTLAAALALSWGYALFLNISLNLAERKISVLQTQMVIQKAKAKADNFESKWKWVMPKEVKREINTTVGTHTINL